MKKIIVALVLLALMVNLVSAVEYKAVPSVVGIITDANGNQIRENGITVKATCYRNGQEVDSGTWVTRDVSQWYLIDFWPKMNCTAGDYVTVEASKDNRVAFNSSTFGYASTKRIDIQMQEAPIVPEFGLVIGGLTAISAIVVFFMIRRK